MFFLDVVHCFQRNFRCNFAPEILMYLAMKKIICILALSFGLSSQAQQVQHIRNATAKVSYADKTFLIDPFLSKKGTYTGFENTPNSELRNPLIDLPFSTEKILKNIDAVIVTHTHADHWDEEAQRLIPKNLPIFVQNEKDAQIIRSQGFEKVEILGENTTFGKVKLTKTGGQHGTDTMYAIPQLAELLGEAMGVVFQAEGQKTLYLVGDTILNDEVKTIVKRFNPEIFILNTGYAQLNGFEGGIIMGKNDVKNINALAPKAKIIAVHMDALNHCTLSRKELREFVKNNQLDKSVLIPNDGKKYKF